ncbi:MAG: response regulator [Deltaproteobacteria bacterium]|nr:response regulator [Deltaproteobacteria bacterium]
MTETILGVDDNPTDELVKKVNYEKPIVLMVDDEEMNLELVEALMVPLGYGVEKARTGREALEKISKREPDIILLDVMMPGMDGYEVCRILKEDEKTRHIPVVMVTALNQIENKVKGIETGADDYLSKPFHISELIARVKSLLKVTILNEKVKRYQDTIRSLFELTTFSEEFSDRSSVLNELAKKTAELTGMEKVAIALVENKLFQVKASYNLGEDKELYIFLSQSGPIRKVIETGKQLVAVGDPEITKRLNLNLSYICIPLKSINKEVIGALCAFGACGDISGENIRVLSLVAQRIASEIQIKDYSRILEETIDKRTKALRESLEKLEEANKEISHAYEEIIYRLSVAAEYKDEVTAAHIHRISLYSEALARKFGLPEEQVKLIKLASPMHDIGKIGIPDSILLKPGKLTPDEFEIMKKHTVMGARILAGSSSPLLRMAEEIAISHHEKYDGSGYPYGIVGESIPLVGRIVALADVFDALTTRREYKLPFDLDKTLSVMKEGKGKHFDPNLVDAFFDILDQILAIKENYSKESCGGLIKVELN